MDFVGGIHIRITGHGHSYPFTSGGIEAGVTPLYAHREWAHSNLEGRPFEVRQDDYEAIVLSLSNEYPSGAGITREEQQGNHGGYVGYATTARGVLVELMDSLVVGPFIKIVCVYTSVVDEKWMRKDGHACKWLPGIVYIFVEPHKKGELSATIANSLSNAGHI